MVKAFDFLDSELYTIQDPHDHDQLGDLDTDFEELLKELASGKREAGTMAIQYTPKSCNETLHQAQVQEHMHLDQRRRSIC